MPNHRESDGPWLRNHPNARGSHSATRLLQSVIPPSRTALICIVSSGKVLQGSQAIRQANLRAGLGVAAIAGTPAEKLEPKEVAELIRSSKRPMEIVFRWVELIPMIPYAGYFVCSQLVKMNPCLPFLYPTPMIVCLHRVQGRLPRIF